ncbi:YadA-like family protein [Snodgrassella communis]|uniref:Trimeric autotransporter adhesin YadA-like C-terminal membrane anchor domain-containing protein n=2 Tax=Snodgrassella TaxID=1193515 RepID=A0A2N9XWV3_9NEIS|nr:YadA-like family protein [Snodgrassella communis]PIT54258.1 hypothetical protein BHC48_00820 [Snodgrassella communis]
MHNFKKGLLCTILSLTFMNIAQAEGGGGNGTGAGTSDCSIRTGTGIKGEVIVPEIGNSYCKFSLTDDVLEKINSSQDVADTAKTTANDALNAANEAKNMVSKSKTTNSAGNNIKVNSSTNADGSTNYEITTADDVSFNSMTSNSIQAGSVNIDRQNADANGHTIIQGVGNGSVTAGSTQAVNGGQLWQVQQKAQEAATKAKTTISSGNNIKVNSSTNADGSTNYEITTADDVSFNSVTSNSIQAGSVNIDRQNADANGHTIIQGVGNGSVAAGSTQVVNGGQLWQVQQEATNEINKIKIGQSGLVLTDGKTTTIDKSGTSSVINISGANGDRILTGVANGVNPNDAVNVSQLRDYQVQNSSRLNALNNKIDHNRKVSSQGIASVAAMSIEYPEQEPGHVATGFGFGTYDGENAIGWSINYLATTGKTKVYGGVAQAFGSGTRAVGKVGISFVF